MKKSFNEDIDESWVERALEMMEAGYESNTTYSINKKGSTQYFLFISLRVRGKFLN